MHEIAAALITVQNEFSELFLDIPATYTDFRSWSWLPRQKLLEKENHLYVTIGNSFAQPSVQAVGTSSLYLSEYSISSG